MRTTALLLAFMLVLTGALPGTAAPAKVFDVKKLTAQADAAESKGSLIEAAQIYSKVFSIIYAKEGYRSPKLVATGLKLVDILTRAKNFKEAEKYMQWVTKSQAREHGAGTFALVDSFRAYGKLKAAQQDYAGAVKEFQKVVKLYDRYDPLNKKLVNNRLLLADTYLKAKNPDAAEAQLKKLQEMLSVEKSLDSDDTQSRIAALTGAVGETRELIEAEKIAAAKKAEEEAKQAEEEKKKKEQEQAETISTSKESADQKVAATQPSSKKTDSTATSPKPVAEPQVLISSIAETTIGPGPEEEYRQKVFNLISRASNIGVGVKNYVIEFNRIEALVAKGADADTVKDRLDSITKSLYRQFQQKAVYNSKAYQNRMKAERTKNDRPKTSTTKFGINPNWKPYEIAKRDRGVESTFGNVPLTEGYLKQLERQIVLQEMKRMDGAYKHMHRGPYRSRNYDKRGITKYNQAGRHFVRNRVMYEKRRRADYYRRKEKLQIHGDTMGPNNSVFREPPVWER